MMFSFTRSPITLSLTSCISGAMVAVSLPSQVEQAKKILVAEKAQWAYVQKVLNDAVQASPHHQKFGLWCKHHPVMSTSLSSLMSTAISFMCIRFIRFIERKCVCIKNHNFFIWTILTAASFTVFKSLTNRYEQLPNSVASTACYSLMSTAIAFICMHFVDCIEDECVFIRNHNVFIWTMLTAVSFAVFKTSTSRYEQTPTISPTACQGALKTFLRKWHGHRNKVPQLLQGLFDGLYIQNESNGDLSINGQQVQKLVEAVMALVPTAQIA